MQWILSLQVEMKPTQINNLVHTHQYTYRPWARTDKLFFMNTHTEKKYLNMNSSFIANYKAHIQKMYCP